MVPFTGKCYPYADQDGKIDFDTYSYVSQYLRLLAQKYKGVIFGVEKQDDRPIVKSLAEQLLKEKMLEKKERG